MKNIRTIMPFFFIAVVAVVVIRSSRTESPAPMPAGSTIYDTAVMMLKEFIIQGQDSNLGFSNFAELDRAWIDTTKGINVYYLRQDSLLHSKMPLDSHLIALNRRIYPVYVGDTLRSSITFERSRFGWKPIIFDDSNIIVTAINNLPKQPHPSVVSKMMLIEAPFVHTQLTRRYHDTGSHFIPSPELRRHLGTALLTPIGEAAHAPIKEEHFLTSLKAHSQSIHAKTVKLIPTR